MPLLQTIPPSRASSQIRPATGPVRHRLRIDVQEYELPFGVTRIGRAESCRIVIEDPAISREHAEVIVERERVVVRDLGSRNGTWLAGERVEGEAELRDGDRLRLGTVDVQIVDCVPRAPMRSTLRLRACAGCSATFAFEERECPQCHAPARDEEWLLGEGVIRTPTDEGRRRGWWLEMHVDLVERALSLWRLDDAQRALQRIEDGMAEHRDGIDAATFDRAFDAAIRLSAAQGDAAWIRWTLETHVAVRRVPSRAVVDRLRVLPPILLEDARTALRRLTGQLAHVGDEEASERLDVLRAVCLELDRFRRRVAISGTQSTLDRATRP
jgi:hypothetical protein